LIAAALLFGFLDPGFATGADSIPVFLGLLIGVTVTTVGFALPTMIFRRRLAGEWGRLRALPLALAIGVACVVLSRAIRFVPGYLYAIVVGLVFVNEVSKTDEAREVAASAVILLGLGLSSWVGLGVVRAGQGFGSNVIETALAMITVATLEAVAFGLLPMRGMPGGILFEERRRLWLILWGVSVLFFFHVIINPQSGYLASDSLVPVATTVGLLVLFTLVSLGLWGFFSHRGRGQAKPTST
jgi:hypothetical protein